MVEGIGPKQCATRCGCIGYSAVKVTETTAEPDRLCLGRPQRTLEALDLNI
jgi:hypothetical protein